MSALDVSIQAQILNLLLELQERLGLTYMFISHDLAVVRHIADDVAVLYGGRLLEYGPVGSVINSPLHPYTQALVSSALGGIHGRRRNPIVGELAAASSPQQGCNFSQRCMQANQQCHVQRPHMLNTLQRSVACIRVKSEEMYA